MEPSALSVNWEETAKVLTVIIVLAFFIERALALIFENEVYEKRLGSRPIKEVLSFVAAVVVVLWFEFDAVAVIMGHSGTTLPGYILTAGVIAGGSKASIKLFRDVLGVRKKTDAEHQAMVKQRQLEADAEKIKVEADVAEQRARLAKARRREIEAGA